MENSITMSQIYYYDSHKIFSRLFKKNIILIEYNCTMILFFN